MELTTYGYLARWHVEKRLKTASDVDFLVDYDLEKITPWFPGWLLIDLELLLNHKVDIATIDILKERTRDRVLHGAVLL